MIIIMIFEMVILTYFSSLVANCSWVDVAHKIIILTYYCNAHAAISLLHSSTHELAFEEITKGIVYRKPQEKYWAFIVISVQKNVSILLSLI